ncbi:MAG: TIGR00180 family glycosyltransferase [Lentisphaeraceae bacterium]|nr:TIGR00180 family glycosyltransferase [Lentisphaeraceae bacterium]
MIIPAHYRHHYLSRLLKYFEAIDIRLIVCDSTDKIYDQQIPQNCEYYHYPDMAFAKKMSLALAKVKSDYVVMCADDDFISPLALAQCEAFLQSNLDYSSVQGNGICFCFDKQKQLQSYPCRLHSLDGEVDSDDLEKRFEECFLHFKDFFYAVHKTTVMTDFFRDTQHLHRKFNGFLIEIAIAFYALINGKNKSLPIFYSAREFIRDSWGASIPDPYELQNDKGGRQELFEIKKICTSYLESKLSSLENATQVIDAAFEHALEFFFDLKQGGQNSSWQSQLFRWVEAFLPSKGEKLLRGMFKRPSLFDQIPLMIEQIEEKKGFPYGSNTAAEREWKQMQLFIDQSEERQ